MMYNNRATVNINWRDGNMKQAGFADSTVVVPLQAGFYSAVLSGPLNAKEVQFKAGGGDVQL